MYALLKECGRDRVARLFAKSTKLRTRETPTADAKRFIVAVNASCEAYAKYCHRFSTVQCRKIACLSAVTANGHDVMRYRELIGESAASSEDSDDAEQPPATKKVAFSDSRPTMAARPTAASMQSSSIRYALSSSSSSDAVHSMSVVG